MKLKPNPCEECPFTNKAMRGYSGPYESIDQLIEVGISDAEYPCHVDQQRDKVSLCNGAVGLMKNICKLPRTHGATHAALMDHTSHPSVFKDEDDMRDYHNLKKHMAKLRRRKRTKAAATRRVLEKQLPKGARIMGEKGGLPLVVFPTTFHEV